MKVGPNQACPCGSGAKFKRCCRVYHHGAPAPTPEALMRSRYAAYATHQVDYVIDTAHPEGADYQADRAAWAREVRAFCEATTFVKLEVLSSSTEGETGAVSFRAHLLQGTRDVSFAEASTFHRVDGRWLYHSGDAL